MKKLQSLILALPLMVAAALVSCSDDSIDTPEPQPELNTVTFKATFPQTRVTYAVNGTSKIKCSWDSNDLNKKVIFERAVEFGGDVFNESYEFYIHSFDNGVATLAYTGTATKAVDIGGHYELETSENASFPSSFTGTATYDFGYDTEQVQRGGKSADHLNNGTKLVATLTNAEAQTNDNDKPKESYITFGHVTSVYRVKFNTPATISKDAHPTLSIETGDKVFGEILLNFNLTQDEEYEVYLHGEPQGWTDKLIFKLDYETDANHVQVYAYKPLHNSVELVAGKFYDADLTGTTPEVPKEYDKDIYEAFGDAPLDVVLSMETAVNRGIPLDENHRWVDGVNNTKPVEYYLQVANDVLKDADGNVLYFYWGELEGHTVDASGQVNMNGSEGQWPENFSYSLLTNNPYNAVMNQKNPATSFYFVSGTLNWKYWKSNIDYLMGTKYAPISNNYYWALKSKYMYVYSYDNMYGNIISKEEVVIPDDKIRDAVSKRWGGRWRMMGYLEALAFLQATTKSETTNGFTYTTPNTLATYPNKSINVSKTAMVAYKAKLSHLAGKFYTWLRFNKPDTGSAQKPFAFEALYFSSDYPTYSTALETNTSYKFEVHYGLPILPVLVLPKKKTTQQ